jgi:hypothetical protein
MMAMVRRRRIAVMRGSSAECGEERDSAVCLRDIGASRRGEENGERLNEKKRDDPLRKERARYPPKSGQELCHIGKGP